MFVSPKIHVLKSYKVMALGGRAFGKYLGHEGRELMNGISFLRKGTPLARKELDMTQKVGSLSLDAESIGTLILDVQPQEL